MLQPQRFGTFSPSTSGPPPPLLLLNLTFILWLLDQVEVVLRFLVLVNITPLLCILSLHFTFSLFHVYHCFIPCLLLFIYCLKFSASAVQQFGSTSVVWNVLLNKFKIKKTYIYSNRTKFVEKPAWLYFLHKAASVYSTTFIKLY